MWNCLGCGRRHVSKRTITPPLSLSPRSLCGRWNEDGLAGVCNRFQNVVQSCALWNGRDPILKERLFGFSGPEGNQGEDVKE